jgi:hypothetical protein
MAVLTHRRVPSEGRLSGRRPARPIVDTRTNLPTVATGLELDNCGDGTGLGRFGFFMNLFRRPFEPIRRHLLPKRKALCQQENGSSPSTSEEPLNFKSGRQDGY